MTEHPPGWHPDPRGRHEHRYWDGTAWTDNVADNGVMGTDPFDAPEAKEETVEAPIGPSMVNLPAIDPSLLQGMGRAPEPAAPASAGPAHRETAGPEDALESMSDALDNAAAALAHKPKSLAAILSIVAPGSGHLYLGLDGARKTMGLILLGAWVAAIVLMWFISFPIGLIVFVAAIAYALFDLRGELGQMGQANASGGPLAMFSDLGGPLGWRLAIAGGALLLISLILPWYRLSVDLGVGGSVSASANAFEAFSIIDLILLAAGVASIVLGVLNLNEGTTKRGVSSQLATLLAALGAASFVLVLFRLLFVPDAGLEFEIERAIGVVLALGATAAVTGGAAGAAAGGSGE